MTDHQRTHSQCCWDWGPKHYECAVREIERLAAQLTAETSNARGKVEYEYEVWQGAVLQAGGRENDYASAQSEASHYAMMYVPDGPVEVRIYEKRLLSAAKVRPKRRPYNASGSLREYGIFPECDTQPPAGVGDVQLDALDRELAEASEALWAERAEWKSIAEQQPEARGGGEADLPSAPVGDGCHCGTCTCNPNMTPAVRFDLSPAQMEGAIRDHLIRLGWTPPEQRAEIEALRAEVERLRADRDSWEQQASEWFWRR